jgi:hypothetical protein
MVGFNPRRGVGKGFISIHNPVKTGSGANSIPIQWVPGVLTPGIKRPRHDAERSPPFSAEVNARSYTFIPQYIFMAWYSVE